MSSSRKSAASRVLILCIIVSGMSYAAGTPAGSSKALVSPLLQFTSKLFPLASEGKKNVIMSPISVHSSISLILLGADNSTETERELLETLGYGGLNSSQVMECHAHYSKLIGQFDSTVNCTLELPQSARAAGCYCNEAILKLLNIVIIKGKYGVPIYPDYRPNFNKYAMSLTAMHHNDAELWQSVSEYFLGFNAKHCARMPLESEEKEEEVILEKDAPLVLFSAIRIQASWWSKFRQLHNELKFHQMGLASEPVIGTVLTSENVCQAKYLELTSSKSQYAKLQACVRDSPQAGELYNELAHLNCRLVEVNLQSKLTFTIIEPLNVSGSGGELAKLKGQLMSGDTLAKVVTLFDRAPTTTQLKRFSFPKFQIENTFNLKSALESMGLSRVFDKSRAEIGQMMEQSGVYIDAIKHEVQIELNEKGIETRGSSPVGDYPNFSFPSHGLPEVDVRNPFLFMLRFEGIPLLMGQLMRA